MGRDRTIKDSPEWKEAEELSKKVGYKTKVCYEWITGKSDPWAPSSLISQEITDITLRILVILNKSPMTYKEIGKHTGMTSERARQIVAKAISKVRNHKAIREAIKEL